MNNVNINVKSFATSTLSFSQPVTKLSDPLPYDYGDIYTWAINGEVLFHGTVISCARELSASSYQDNIEVACFWDLLARTIYVNDRGEPKCVMGSINSCEVDGAIKEILRGVEFDVDITLEAKYIPYSANCNTLEQMLTHIKRSLPNLQSWWDYTAMKVDSNGLASGVAKLVFGLRNRGALYTLGVDKLTQLSIAQSKQQSNGVILKYRWITNKGNVRVIEERSRPSATGFSQGVSVIELSEESTGQLVPKKNKDARLNISRQTMTIKGIPVPRKGNASVSKKFWDVADGRFEESSLEYGTVVIKTQQWTGNPGEDAPKNYVAAEHGYILVDGSIHPKTRGLKWCRATIAQAITPTARIEDANLRSVFNLRRRADGKRYAWLMANVILISVPRRTYTIGGKYDYIPESGEEPEEPEEDPPNTPYADIARQMDEGYLDMGWTGSLTIIGDRARQALKLLGGRVGIVGGDKRWQALLVQTVTYAAAGLVGDVTQAESATITFGMPEHTSFCDFGAAQEPAKTAEKTAASAVDPAGWSGELGGGEPEGAVAQPNITSGTSAQSSVVDDGVTAFQVRSSSSDTGAAEMSIHKGTVYYPLIGHQDVGKKDWTAIAATWREVWLVIDIDLANKSITAELAASMPTAAETDVKRYVKIATIKNDGDIIQHWIGDYHWGGTGGAAYNGPWAMAFKKTGNRWSFVVKRG